MGLKKGDVINPNGRPKGAVNKSTSEIRKAFQQLVSNNLETLQSDLDNMEPERRVSYILKLSEFILPKLQTVSIENQLQLEYKELTALLQKAPAEAIDAITAKLLTIKTQDYEV